MRMRLTERNSNSNVILTVCMYVLTRYKIQILHGSVNCNLFFLSIQV